MICGVVLLICGVIQWLEGSTFLMKFDKVCTPCYLYKNKKLLYTLQSAVKECDIPNRHVPRAEQHATGAASFALMIRMCLYEQISFLFFISLQLMMKGEGPGKPAELLILCCDDNIGGHACCSYMSRKTISC